MTALEVRPLLGIGEVAAGDDLAELLAGPLASLQWADGTHGVAGADIVVVTSKVVAKAEGRLVPAADRQAAISAEAVHDVTLAPGPPGGPGTRVVRTRHGLVLASAGVDASNVPAGFVLLLPADPDASARRLRAGLAERLGVRPGVLVTDTAGRPWRLGQVDIAVGAAGVRVVDDLRGQPDDRGRTLTATMPAVADEVAAAAELMAGKTRRVPAVVVRGLPGLVTQGDGPGAAALVRAQADDLFTLGTPQARAEGVALGRCARVDELVQAWRPADGARDRPVPAGAVRAAIAAAERATLPRAAASGPAGTPPWRLLALPGGPLRHALPDGALAADEAIVVLVRRASSDQAQVVGARADAPGAGSGREEGVLGAGAAVAVALTHLAAAGLGASWVPAPGRDLLEGRLGPVEDHVVLGILAVGWPAGPAPGPQPTAPGGTPP